MSRPERSTVPSANSRASEHVGEPSHVPERPRPPQVGHAACDHHHAARRRRTEPAEAGRLRGHRTGVLEPHEPGGVTCRGDRPGQCLDAERRGNTEANLARAPEVAGRAVTAAGIDDWNAFDLLGASDVSSDPGADVLYFTVRGRDPTRAQRLATEYAEQFVNFRTELDVAATERALKSVQQRLNTLSAAGQASSPLYGDLVEKKNQLETISALYTTNASVVRPADSAHQIEPNSPTRSAALGLGLGIALAIALAFLADALDTRVKTIDELEDGLAGLPILGRVPDPAKEVSEGDVAMLTDPASRYAESIRMLRVSLALGTTELQPRLIMVTSANPREGKSTTVANLAVALAQAGRRVVLCDLDARRPTLIDCSNSRLTGADRRGDR